MNLNIKRSNLYQKLNKSINFNMKIRILFFSVTFLITILFANTTSVAQQKKGVKGSINVMAIKQMAYADSVRLVDMYKDLHQNPELGFMEVRTSGIIATELQALGYQVKTGIAKTGVVGILKNGDGPVVMYRADMDCNSVKEITGLPYASTKTMKKDDGTEFPVMHACGHDAHATWLLGVAKIMMASKNQWKGTLVFLGQPAEEPLTGAKAMVNDKMYEKGVPVPDYLFGLHTTPFAVGSIKNGVGERSAQDAAVLTVGAIHSGGDNNVIPPSAVVKLNLRWFTESTRNILLDGINRINEGIAVANGLPKESYPTILMKGRF